VSGRTSQLLRGKFSLEEYSKEKESVKNQSGQAISESFNAPQHATPEDSVPLGISSWEEHRCCGGGSVDQEPRYSAPRGS
jgi:hypothetical protein